MGAADGPQAGRRRVVSLLPSATDALEALGCAELLVGRSHECDHALPCIAAATPITSPKASTDDTPSFKELDAIFSASKAAVAGAALLAGDMVSWLHLGLAVFRVDLRALAELRPDVVLTQVQGLPAIGDGAAAGDAGAARAEAIGAVEAALEELVGKHVRVVHLEADTLDEAMQDVRQVAGALGLGEKGEECVKRIRRRMDAAAEMARGRAGLRVACIQWPDPLYAALSWVPELIRLAGGKDVLEAKARTAFGSVSASDVAQADPEVIVVAVCGLSRQKCAAVGKTLLERFGREWRETAAVKNRRVVAVDAVRLFSRPGPLLADTLEALCEIFHSTFGEMQPFGHGERWQVLL
ncbi:unnamed protein product [Pedinophyceae sp. YPF-701]|nr:unnamed protein product [Pedinophyceae sp. YPF-701]